MRTTALRKLERLPLAGALRVVLRGARLPLILPFAASLAMVLLLAPASTAFGQVSATATIRGTIKDPNGAVVPKAAVTLINQDTKFERKTVGNDVGSYSFTAVDPGLYTIKVEIAGFKTAEEPNLRVDPSATMGQDIVLEVGATSETVTVTAAQEQLEKDTGAKSDTLNTKQIDNLSIISRSSLELLRILPGIVAPNLDDPAFESLSFGGGANANANYAVNGLRGVNVNTSIDGSRVMDIGSNNGSMITANPDMVQEVTIQTSNYAAEHGSSGVQITATTKGGSSAYHGEVYDYERNHALNANDRSNTLFGISRPNSVYHFPGGNIGGPIPLPFTNFNKNKDKLFFFFGFEVQRQTVDPGTTFDITPTAAQRAGDFVINGVNRHFTADPAGQAFINFYPLPNYTPTKSQDQRLNYLKDVLTPTNRNQAIGRVDYNITNSTKMYVRLAREQESADQPNGIWWGPSAFELPSHVLGTNLGRSLSVNLTQIINPTMTNEIVFSTSRLLLDNNYADPNRYSLASLGIPNFKGPFGQQSKFANPAFITSWGGQTIGDLWSPGGNPLFAHNDSTSITDNLSKVHGTHTLKFGGTGELAHKQQNNSASTEGMFIFAPWGSGSTGNEFADLLTGKITQYSQSTAIPIGKFKFYNLELYAQDSWKVRSNLTLEYGLRVAYLPNNYETQGLGVVFDPRAYDRTQGTLINGDPSKPNGILQAKLGQIPLGLVGNNAPQVMPRLNFAWDISGKGDTVIRGGAGLFYNRVQGNYQYYSLNQPPNSYTTTVQGVTYQSIANVANPFAGLGSVNITTANLQSNFIPRIATMSLSVARKLPKNTILEVAYVGTEGRHLPDIRNGGNVIPIGTLLSGHVGNADLSVPVQRWAVAGQGSVLNKFRPFPAWGTIGFDEYAATSSYHSLQATLSHQAGKNLQFFANYTFSKALGTTGVNETDGNGIDPLDARHKSWGVLPYDRTHVFNLSYNYNIPDIARGRLENGFTKAAFNGWQMSGISTIQSGVPFRLKFAGDLGGSPAGVAFYGSDAFGNSGISSSPVAPIFTCNPLKGGNGYNQVILDINCIKIPTLGQTGNYVPPFYMRSPSRMNHDISFFKNFRITESKRIQFRTGFFDIFNQAYPRYNQFAGQSTNDVNTTLQTVCNVQVNNVPNGNGGTSNNVCDPTQGFHFDTNTLNNFGKIINKHGHRTIELALKFYF